MNIKLQEVIDYFESQSALAKVLNVGDMAVSQWKKRGVPPKRAMQIEKLTNKQFIASDLIEIDD